MKAAGEFMTFSVRPLRKGAIRESEYYAQASTREVVQLVSKLAELGWRRWEIASALRCSNTQLWKYLRGDVPVSDPFIRALRELVAEALLRSQAQVG